MTSPMASSRVNVLATRGGSLVARGAVAIVFGVLVLVVPPPGLLTLVILWGSYAFADGIICAVVAIWARGDGARCGWLAFEGLVSVATGALTVLWRDPTVVVLLNVIVAWAVLVGFSEVVGAIRLRRLIAGERVLAGMAIVSSAVGTVLLVVAGPRALGHPWLIDAYALLFGALLIALGVGADHHRSRTEGRSES